MSVRVIWGLAMLLFAASAALLLWSALGKPENFTEPAYAQEQGQCTEVATFGPTTEDQITEPFPINGNTIRLTADLTSLNEGLSPFLTVTLSSQQDELVFDGVVLDQEGAQTENFLVGSDTQGPYTLEIEANDTRYTLTVEDCGASPVGGGGQGEQPQKTVSEPTSPPKQTLPKQGPEPTLGDEPANGDLLESGGPLTGPAPLMPDGNCPPEYPVKKSDGCYTK